VRLEEAIAHHLDVRKSLLAYDPVKTGVPPDLTHRLGPSAPLLPRLDPLLASPAFLTKREFHDLVGFVRDGLFDERARTENLCRLVPASVPSGLLVMTFQTCQKQRD
jgi:hypothetical protein